MLNFNQIVEEAPRLAEFKRALAKGYSPQKAGAKARDLTLNFARAGTQGRQWNRYSAFFNATIQGFDKFCRMMHDRLPLVLLTSQHPALSSGIKTTTKTGIEICPTKTK